MTTPNRFPIFSKTSRPGPDNSAANNRSSRKGKTNGAVTTENSHEVEQSDDVLKRKADLAAEDPGEGIQLEKRVKLAPLREQFQKMLKVVVGSEEEEYMVHRERLCSISPFFKLTCESGFKESVEGVIYLPEVESNTFDYFLQWLYLGQIWRSDDLKPVDWAEFTAAFRLFNFAHFARISQLRNNIVNAVIMAEKADFEMPLKTGLFDDMYDSLPEDSTLARLLVEWGAFYTHEKDFFKMARCHCSQRFLANVGIRLLEARGRRVFKKNEPHTWRSFHEHDDLQGERLLCKYCRTPDLSVV